jgi:hypothetical protein
MTKKKTPPPPSSPSPLLTDADADLVVVKNRKKNRDDDEQEEEEDDDSSPTSLFHRMITPLDAVPDAPATAPASAAVNSLQALASPSPPPPTTVNDSSSSSSSSSSSCNSSSITVLSAKLSRFLQWYAGFMSSAVNQEIGLKFLQYTLWVAAKVIGSHYGSNNSSNSSNSQQAKQQQQRQQRMTRIAAFCSKLSNDLSFARYMTRLFGLPTAMEAALHGSWASDSTLSSSSNQDKRKMNRLDAILGKILAYSMVLYYPAEHVAFVHWMVPPVPVPAPAPPSTTVGKKTPPPRTAERWSAWSCRCWVVYVVTEIVQCLLQYRKQQHEQQRLLVLLQQQQQQQVMSNIKNNNDGTDESSTITTIIQQQQQANHRALRNVKLQLVRNALFLLPTIHWSLPNWDTQPWLPPSLVNTLMWLETMVHLYKNAT